MLKLRWALLGVTLTALAAGGVARLAGAPTVADYCWIAGTVSALLPAAWWVVKGLRAGRFGVDVLAVLSLVGALAVGEYLAGALIGVMLATGQALDAAAERRATKDLRALLDRVPRTARRRTPDGVEMVELDVIAVGDVVVVGPGEVLPVDGLVHSERAVLDDSALTGEPLQVNYDHGAAVRSGSLNAGGGMEIRASATAADSTYAGIVRLAKQAAAETAPTGAPRRPGGRLVRPAGSGSSPVRRGCSADQPPERWRCWWWPPRARCCWPHRWRSCPGCRGHRASVCWCAAAARWNPSARQPLWCSIRPGR